MWPLLGAFVSGGLGLAGSVMQNSSNARAARLNAIYQASQNQMDRDINAANFAASTKEAQRQFNKNYNLQKNQFSAQIHQANIDRELQREFAQNGVQWRVNDAKASGIHPLAALGMQGPASTPIAITGGSASGSVPTAAPESAPPLSPYAGNNSIAGAMGSFGQDISRAITATATEHERLTGVQSVANALSLENQSLQNQLLAVQIAKTSGAAVGPSMPSQRQTRMVSGQGNTPARTGYFEPQPNQPVISNPKSPSQEVGEMPGVGYERTPTGWAPVQSATVKERNEDDVIAGLIWDGRNRLLPTFQQNLNPPAHVKLDPGEKWIYNPFYQEYRKIKPFRVPSASERIPAFGD